MDRIIELGQDIVKLWDVYSGFYLDGILNTLILALVATLFGCIIGAGYGDDTIAIISGLGKDSCAVGCIGQRNAVAFLAQVSQNLLGCLAQLQACSIVCINFVDAHRVLAFQ